MKWLSKSSGSNSDLVSQVVFQFLEALKQADFDKIKLLVEPDLYKDASGDTLNIHLVSIPKKFQVVFKNDQNAIVTGDFELQIAPSGRPDIIKTLAKFLLVFKDNKWVIYNYAWRDYLLQEKFE